MSRIIMKLVLVLALVAIVRARPDDDGRYYDTRYENFDIDAMTSSDRLLKSYTLCFLDQGKCTPEGNDFKKWIPEATQSSCGKCTEKQKTLVAKCIKAIREKLPAEYEALLKKHDPEGKYRVALDEFVDKYGH